MHFLSGAKAKESDEDKQVAEKNTVILLTTAMVSEWRTDRHQTWQSSSLVSNPCFPVQYVSRKEKHSVKIEVSFKTLNDRACENLC